MMMICGKDRGIACFIQLNSFCAARRYKHSVHHNLGTFRKDKVAKAIQLVPYNKKGR